MARIRQMSLQVLGGTYAVCRLPAGEVVPSWAGFGGLSSVTRTPDELSIVCIEEAVPTDIQAERGWRVLGVQGSLDFNLTGVLAGLLAPLASAGISVFSVSTYNTDYLLVRMTDLVRTITVLQGAGYRITEPMP